MIKHIFFDLDGTLLPMNQELFVKAYFTTLSEFSTRLGIEPMKTMQGLKVSLEGMAKNDGSITNEDAFWNSFIKVIGGEKEDLIPKFESYYHEIFPGVVSKTCGYNPNSLKAIEILKEKNYPLYILTNPLFPRLATAVRVKQAGLKAEDFKEITTYENYHSCKPSVAYYQEVLHKYQLEASECLMIGNDMSEDAVVTKLGMQVYIVTDELINKENKDMNMVPHGDFNELLDFLKGLPELETQ